MCPYQELTDKTQLLSPSPPPSDGGQPRSSHNSVGPAHKSGAISPSIRRRRFVALFFVAAKFAFLWPFTRTPSNATDEPMHVEQNATNKTLVILMGNLRGGEEAWKSLYMNVLFPNDADLALLVQNDTTTPYPNSSLVANAKYVWWYNPYDDWADAIDLINGTGWRETHLPQFAQHAAFNESQPHESQTPPSILFGGIKGYGFEGSGMLIFMLRWFVSQHLVEEKILHKYDKYVVGRIDNYYLCPHRFSEFDVRSNTIWIPKGQEFGGYTDRHLVVGRDNILDALDILPHLITRPFRYKGERHYNTECFVKYVWGQKNLTVKKFARGMFTVGTKHDTGYQRAILPFHGVQDTLVKYKMEYLRAKTCLEYNTTPSSHWELHHM